MVEKETKKGRGKKRSVTKKRVRVKCSISWSRRSLGPHGRQLPKTFLDLGTVYNTCSCNREPNGIGHNATVEARCSKLFSINFPLRVP
jgi:hypothetical protein